MKSNIIVDAIGNTITVSKSFYKRASVYGSAEYAELRKAMLENPSFHIEFKSSEKKTYSGLSLARMEAYIKTQNNSKERLIEFEAIKTTSKARGGKYPMTKKWFFKTYPEYKESSITASESAKETAKELMEKRQMEKRQAESQKLVSTVNREIA